MRVLITGAAGQLGRAAAREADRRGHEIFAADLAEFDLANPVATRAFLAMAAPEAILHCGAYTAVDRAEQESARAFAVNEAGTRCLADYAAARGCWLLYVSTDYVFDGSGSAPHETGDATNPLNVYGASKLAGERAVQTLCKTHMIVRTSWVFGPGGRHFVNTMRRLGQQKSALRVVNDQIGSPTYTVDLARLLWDMLERPTAGVFHGTNAGFCSWAEFAKTIFQLSNIPCEVTAVPSSQYPQAAQRPLNSRLSPQSLLQAGYALPPPWQDALKRYLTL